jgi:multidrug efflux pump subunit AcrA (membrane-fusion protein)
MYSHTLTRIALLLTGFFFWSSCSQKNSEIKPVRKAVTETVFASGILVPEDKYNLTAQNNGYLVALNFMEGDTVKEGKVLAVIENKQNAINAQSADELLSIASVNASPDAPALKQAEANLELAKQKLNEDELQQERYKKLLSTNSVSKLEYENVALACENSKATFLVQQENYKQLKQQADQQLIMQKAQKDVNGVLKNQNEIKAVVGGKIYKKLKLPGDYVRTGDVIAEIGDVKRIYAKLSVDETNIKRVKLGQDVIIQLNTNKEKNYPAKVTEIYPAFDDQAQSFYVKAEFTGELDFKISGTQLQGNITTGQKPDALVIPRVYLGFGNKVNVKGKGTVVVVPGFISDEWVEIISGLDETNVILPDQTK